MPATVKNLAGYKSLVGVANDTDTNHANLEQLQNDISTELRKENSALSSALSNMSEKDKALTINALITNDTETISKIISPLIHGLNIKAPNTEENLKQITKHNLK